MLPDAPAPPPPPIQPANRPPAAKRNRFLLYLGGGLLAFLVLVVATLAITLWWIQRPIKPVVLSPREKAVVDQKIQRLETGDAAGQRSTDRAANSRRQSISPVSPRSIGAEDDGKQLRIYVPGSKALKLTEREVNGLLNVNTDLGNSVRLEFAQDAINAYLAVRIPEDFPIGGGRMFRARGRFRVSLGNGDKPYAILEDVTVLGLSLPKAWLGGLKGENLIGEAMTGKNQSPLLKGIKSLRVEPGALVLEVED
jgi:hypothetical protein